MTAMSCNAYPSWEGRAYEPGTLRRIAHTDFELITLLFQRPGQMLAPRIFFNAALQVTRPCTAMNANE